MPRPKSRFSASVLASSLVCESFRLTTVVWPGRPGQVGSTLAPIINDIKSCNLQQVSWVIPDEAASDHPGNKGYGPSFVANIVDAIGKSWLESQGGNHCDYWGRGCPILFRVLCGKGGRDALNLEPGPVFFLTMRFRIR